MLDSAGHLIHIDFGFVFGLAPGKQFSMEKAPWKLTIEMTEVMTYILHFMIQSKNVLLFENDLKIKFITTPLECVWSLDRRFSEESSLPPTPNISIW